MPTSLDQWWPRLPQETRDWLVAHNGDVVPPEVLAEIARVSGPVTTDAWWVDRNGPDGLYLTDDAVDWIEATANGEQPAPRDD